MIDAHCHLDDRKFRKDLDDVVERARRNLKAVITCSSSFHSNFKNREISEKFRGFVFPCFGLYPGNFLKEGKLDETINFIRENSRQCVGIGEIGLDYYWFKKKEDEVNQLIAFSSFIELANELKKPLVVHSRSAEDECMNVLEKKADTSVVMHCFCGSPEQARKAVDLGFFVSLATRHCWLKDSKALITSIPLDYMLTETDSPYNHPERSGRNEPANVGKLVEFISSVKEEAFDSVDKITEKNAVKVFGIKGLI